MGGGEGEAMTGNGSGPGAALPVFRGVTEIALDAKGRLAIPTRHREALVGVSGGTQERQQRRGRHGQESRHGRLRNFFWVPPR